MILPRTGLVWATFLFVALPKKVASKSLMARQDSGAGEAARDLSFLDIFSLHIGDHMFDEILDTEASDRDDGAPICNDKHSNRYDPLACWLWNIKVVVPDQSFKKSLVTVKVANLSCSSFVVESIGSAYIPPNATHTNPSINLVVQGISASCTGKYHATGGASGKIALTATNAEDQPAIHLTWDFVSSFTLPNGTASKYWIPTALKTQQCNAELKMTELHCTGSASAEIVNLFSGIIKGGVSSQLNEILCPQIQEAVDPVASETIVSTVQNLIKYVPNGNSSNLSGNLEDALLSSSALGHELLIQADKRSTVVDFEQDTPLLVKSLKSVNRFLDCFYGTAGNSTSALEKKVDDNKRSQNNCTSLVTKGLKGVLSTLLYSLAEEVHFPIPKALHKITFKLPQYGRVSLDIQDLHIRGLDQLGGLSLLSPIRQEGAELSDFFTRIRAGAGLNVTADVNITVFPIPGGIIHGDPLHESFHVHFNVSTFDAVGAVSMGLRSDQFQKLHVATVLDALPAKFHPHFNSSHNSSVDRTCLLDSIQSLQVKTMELQTKVQSVTLVPLFNTSARQRRRRLSPITDKLEKELDDVFNHVLELVLKEYQPLLTDAAAGFANTALVSKVNHWIDDKILNRTIPAQSATRVLELDAATSSFLVHDVGGGVCSSGDEKTPKLINFTTLGFLQKMNDYVNKPSTLSSVNNALDKLAAKADRHHNFSAMTRSLMTWASRLGTRSIPGVSLQLRDLQIDNAGSIQHIDVLSPELDGLHLRTGFVMGVQNTTATGINGVASPTIHASIGIVYRPRKLAATLNFTLSLGEIYLDGGELLRFDMTRFRELSLIELFSHGHCLLVPFEGHRIYNDQNKSRIGALLANASVNVLGDANFKNFTTYMDTTTYPSAGLLITSLIGWTLNTLQLASNSFARSSFDQAESYCTGGQKFGFDDDPPKLHDEYADHWLRPVLGIFGSLFAVAQVVFYVGHRAYTKRRETRAVSYDAVSEPLLSFENGELEHLCEEEETKTTKDESLGETLAQSVVLSAFSRQAVPVFIVGTVVLLLSSNISSGATVDLSISLSESRTISLPAVFTFSLLNTARDMWQAQIYPLFFLVLIMSGIWPYTKLLLMLGSWTAPPHILKTRTRERLLLALDALGKFALIDFLLFALMMVAFRYHLGVTDHITVDVFVSPETGFYSFLAATCFSLIIGHFMVYCHRLSEMRNLSPRHEESLAHLKESVLSHNYVVGYRSEGEHRLSLSRRSRGMLLVTAMLAVVLLSIGITRKSFKFEIGGIAGDLLGEQRTTYYSLISLGSSLRRSVKDPLSIGTNALEIIYYFYAVVTPFACLGILFILLLCPMTLPTQRFVLALAEIANAWSAVEVFVIAIIASLLEISTFASFIVGHRCDLIKQILKEYFASAIADASDATCFTVRPSVEPSSVCLILGVLVNSMIVSIILRFAHCSVAERIRHEMQSSLVKTEDALNPETSRRPRTIAGFLSCRISSWFFFDNVATSGETHRYGFLPQSTDTYSVAAEVNWQEEASHFDSPTGLASPFERRHAGPASPLDGPSPFDGRRAGPAAPDASVLETIRDAFD